MVAYLLVNDTTISLPIITATTGGKLTLFLKLPGGHERVQIEIPKAELEDRLNMLRVVEQASPFDRLGCECAEAIVNRGR